ncbi:MAG: xanthine dehydrogenase family protein molybdopterin-binding subunit [Burkholderiales bacterium]|nr:xanthine dehydrogenase family protein molybdopterin-binding subunit [Burkholderiales bacterium]
MPRVEDARFLQGLGRYTDDIVLPGQIYAAFVRSPHAHAAILALDTAPAVHAPGVVAVLTGADYVADGLEGVRHMPNPADPVDVSQRAFVAPQGESIVDLAYWPLATHRVRHVGEPVALVAATSAAAARDAAELVEIRYEELPAVVSPVEAMAEGAPQLWDEVPRNLCFSLACGDAHGTERALASAAHVIRHEFIHNRVASCHLEPRAALGSYDEERGLYTLITGNQGVFPQKLALAAALKLPAERVRVVCPDVGGAFGTRSNLYPEQVAVVWAAKRLGRPVKWTADRSEAFQSDYQGRDAVVRAALALDRKGVIQAYRLEWFGNIGSRTVAYVALANGRRIPASVYHVPVACVRSHAVLTNTLPTAPYRGSGRPEAIHMLERLLDMAARELGIERTAIRRRNMVTKDMMPYRSVMDIVYDSGDFHAYMEQVLAASEWNGFAARKAEARARGRLAGIGVANHISGPVGAPFERTGVRVLGTGTVEVTLGTQSSGQGHETSFAQIMADALGVPFGSVKIRYGDTDFVTLGGGTHSERSLRICGTLILRAAEQIVERGRAAAALILEAAAQDVVYEAPVFRIQGTDRTVGLFEVAAAIESPTGAGKYADPLQALQASIDFQGRIPAYPAGAAVCELEVDPATGAVEITRYTTVDDAGQPINPMLITGQTHGGIAQGVGQALYEGIVYDGESGQVLTGSFADYCLCRADSLPAFSVGQAEHPTEGNPLRIKGGAEAGIMPATAAVINALCDALAEAGVDDVPMPATPALIRKTLSAG